MTHLAEHLKSVSHDTIRRFLLSTELSSEQLWNNVQSQVELDGEGYLIFDDSVLDKSSSEAIELARRLYSGNQHRVIMGIAIISCIYVHSRTGEFWLIDYRIYSPTEDEKTKNDHVIEMLNHLVTQKNLPFRTVLTDCWYSSQRLMAAVDCLKKIYYCPLKVNRLVDDSQGTQRYERIDQLNWSDLDENTGKLIKIRGFPRDKKVKLFRVTMTDHRTEYIATNDLSQTSLAATKAICKLRWKIEEFHRELKQLTGIEHCQCRKSRIQRNHIACALLVWSHLKQLARRMGQTVYQLKQALLSDYLTQQLHIPSIPIKLIHI